jgi:3' terminal RNA ribose 2'-O-methyltransferase Hen1
VLLTISTSMSSATDLGFLLHKHPGRVQSFTQSTGTAHVFYPEATDERCTAALMLEVDPIALVRSGGKNDFFGLGQYVNDRPYAASSMLAIAVKQVFRTALSGRCDARPELAATPIPLELRVPALSCSEGADFVRRMFEPLGWTVSVSTRLLDDAFPDWGESPYLDVQLSGTIRLADALNHMYVLLPVLDDTKHYWVGDDEVEKLIRAGSGWLADHPDRALIASRYLAHQRDLAQSALGRLAEVDDLPVEALEPPEPDAAAPRPTPLFERRKAAVLREVFAASPRSVGDLGCGEGALLGALLDSDRIERVVAVDVSVRALRTAAKRLHLERMLDAQRARIEIFQSSLVYRDARLADLDVAVLMEVVEHIDPTRLSALERTVFGDAAPGRVIVTTPNADYNVRYPALEAGAHRHADHRFEWTRAEFARWAADVCARYGYAGRREPIGDVDPEVGPPTQMWVFTKEAGR